MIFFYEKEEEEDPETFEAKFEALEDVDSKIKFLRDYAGKDEFKNFMADQYEELIKNQAQTEALKAQAQATFRKQKSEEALKKYEEEGQTPVKDEL